TDYTAISTTVTFGPGTTTQQVTVPIIGDIVIESAETFFVTLSGASNATLADAQGLGTIQDNDAPLSILAINDVTVVEGSTGAADAVFMVTLTGATALPVAVNFATADSSAVAVADYQAQTGILIFAPGVTAQTITVAVLGDSAVESTKQFSVTLSGPVNAALD